MEIPKGRKAQFTEQIISRITPEMRVRVQKIKDKTGATEADILRAAIEKFVEAFEAEEERNNP